MQYENEEEAREARRRVLDRSWYALPAGLLLRRLMELEVEAKDKGLDVAKQAYDWLKMVSLELACQVEDPVDSFSIELMDGTDRRIRRNGGAPYGNRNASMENRRRHKKAREEASK